MIEESEDECWLITDCNNVTLVLALTTQTAMPQ